MATTIFKALIVFIATFLLVYSYLTNQSVYAIIHGEDGQAVIQKTKEITVNSLDAVKEMVE